MTNEVYELIPTKRIKKPSYSLYCGISVKTDGTENDEIVDYDNLLIKNNENFNENDGDNELFEEGEN
ncbi:17396_t:CDS:2, partial [Funneliformis caledonium]